MTSTEFQEKLRNSSQYQSLLLQQQRREEQWKLQEQWHREEEARVERIRAQRRKVEQSIQSFFETEGLLLLDPEGKITSRQLYDLYRNWCIREGIPVQPPRAFFLYAKKNASSLSLVYSVHIPAPDGKRVRGFYGARVPERGDGADNYENS